MPALRDLTGQTFGMLKVIRRADENLYGKPAWVCRCKCGKIKTISKLCLLKGDTVSCGCFRAAFLKSAKFTRGHGLTETAEHRAWSSMWNRCVNKNNQAYDNYGGRGIKVCRRWRSFEIFLADMGPRPSSGHSLDRKKNHLGYFPSNCRWATRSQQNKNRRPLLRDELGRYA